MLAPCLDCARHVRSGEVRCPFCASARGSRTFEPRMRGLTRAAIFAASTALAACGTASVEPEPEPEETIMQPYGAPPDPQPEPLPPRGPELPPEGAGEPEAE